MTGALSGNNRKPAPPESLNAARRFDQRVKQYRAAGLCRRCAAQAAFGHTDGWLKVHPPCSVCLPIVHTFPPSGTRMALPAPRRTGRQRP
jgi:hypothetical protein